MAHRAGVAWWRLGALVQASSDLKNDGALATIGVTRVSADRVAGTLVNETTT